MKKLILIFLFSAGILSADVLLETAQEAFLQGKYKKALFLYKKALDEGGNAAIIYFNLANTHFKLGDIGRAIVHYEKTIKLAPDFKDSYLNIGRIHYQYENYRQSLDAFLAYLKRNPADLETLLLSGDVYLKLGLHTEADRKYSKAMELYPTNPDPYIAQSDMYNQLGDVSRAFHAITEGLKAVPYSLNLMEMEAMYHYQEGRHQEAAITYEEIISYYSNLSTKKVSYYYYQMADAFIGGAYTNLAIYALELSVGEDKDNMPSYDLLGNILLNAGKYKQALELYSRLYDINRAQGYLGMKNIFTTAHNNNDLKLIARIMEFYREKGLRDDLYEYYLN